LRFSQLSSCSYSRRGGAVDGDRPGGEGKRGRGLDKFGETDGGIRRTGGEPIVMVVQLWDSPVRSENGGGESGIRKHCSFSSSSSIIAPSSPLLISSVPSSPADSIAANLRVLPFPYVFFFHIFLGTASGTPIGICASCSRRSAAVVSLDSPPMN
jgi:hypothetical protein